MTPDQLKILKLNRAIGLALGALEVCAMGHSISGEGVANVIEEINQLIAETEEIE